jgi:hypothetical protein
MQKFAPSLLAVGLAAALVGCQENGPQDDKITINKNPYPSTYQPLSTSSTLITNATVLTGTGERLDEADVLLVDGKVQQVGKDLTATADITIDAHGKWVTPGIIDVHSHLGAYPSPSVESHQDGNEMTSPNTLQKCGLSILFGHKTQALIVHAKAALLLYKFYQAQLTYLVDAALRLKTYQRTLCKG